ncbi:MAG: D-alanyl-D-alanine carboxypeptidase, partial [Firmicutes bacterium]|nr:D-alanyl-D-alanine carboxypeptidase [Bacillota bacterium]
MNGSAVRRLLLGGLIGYWLLAASPVWCAEPVVSAAGALLLDAETGQVLWEQDGYTPRPPASTTKILTALLCLDIAPLDREVTVTPAASAVGESSAGLLAGEDFVLGELLNAALLKSAN